VKEDFKGLAWNLVNLTFYEGVAEPTGGQLIRLSLAQSIKAYCEKYDIPQDTMPFLQTVPKGALTMSIAGVGLVFNHFSSSITALMSCYKLKFALDCRKTGPYKTTGLQFQAQQRTRHSHE
jgi:hypothetical protein